MREVFFSTGGVLKNKSASHKTDIEMDSGFRNSNEICLEELKQEEPEQSYPLFRRKQNKANLCSGGNKTKITFVQEETEQR